MAGLLFYMHDGPKTFRLELSGNLAGAEAQKLDQAWRTASSTFDGKVFAVDVTFLTAADQKGRDLLGKWSKAGAHFIAKSDTSRALVESATGRPPAPCDPAVGATFDPSFTGSAFRAAATTLILATALLFPATASAAANESEQASAVLERYSAQITDRAPDTTTMMVTIEASLPRFEKQARVEAIRRWSDGRRDYQFLSVEGDSLVRNEVIARYLAIEQGRASAAAPITKSNYKFRFIATRGTDAVFRITPRRKRKGMIAGELWIDTGTGLVTHLSGRTVKSPSLMVRRVDISQETEIRNGAAFIRETRLVIDTRFTGLADLTIREKAFTAKSEVARNVAP